MLVLYKKEVYSLDMHYPKFFALKDGMPTLIVEIWGITTSNYRNEPLKVEIGDLNSDLHDDSVLSKGNAYKNLK